MRRGRVPSPALSPLPAAPLAKVPSLYAGAPTWLLSPTWDAGILGADEANCGHLSLSAADGQLQSSDTSPSLSPSPTPQPSSQSSSPSPSPSPSSSPSPSHEGTPQSPRHRLAQVLLHTTPLSPSLGGSPLPTPPAPRRAALARPQDPQPSAAAPARGRTLRNILRTWTWTHRTTHTQRRRRARRRKAAGLASLAGQAQLEMGH